MFLYQKKFRFAFKEDTDLFLYQKKFRSASKEDANQFLCQKKFRYASKEDRDQFFGFEKNVIMCRFLKLKRKIITTKELRTCFKEKFNNIWHQHQKLKIKEHILNLFMHQQVELIEEITKKGTEKLPLAWTCSSQ